MRIETSTICLIKGNSCIQCWSRHLFVCCIVGVAAVAESSAAPSRPEGAQPDAEESLSSDGDIASLFDGNDLFFDDDGDAGGPASSSGRPPKKKKDSKKDKKEKTHKKKIKG